MSSITLGCNLMNNISDSSLILVIFLVFTPLIFIVYGRIYKAGKVNKSRFDWYTEGYYFSQDPLGNERAHYERKRYSQTFDKLATQHTQDIANSFSCGELAQFELALNNFITIFIDYSNPFANDKTGHYANLVNSIYVSNNLDGPMVAEKILLRASEIGCVSLVTVLRMIDDKEARNALFKWKNKIKTTMNGNSNSELACEWCTMDSAVSKVQCPICGFKSSTNSLKGLMKHWNNNHVSNEFPKDSCCEKHSKYKAVEP